MTDVRDAEKRLREEVRDTMSTFETESQEDVTWRIVRKAILVIFLCVAAYALLQQFGGDDSSSPAAGSASGGGAERQRAAYARAQADDAEEWDVSDSTREMVIRSGPGGHFTLDVSVNGADMPFLVDTGATSVFLSAAAAREAGLDPDTLDYTMRARTANGMIRAAPVVLREVRIGQLSIRDVQATVGQHDLSHSLLGMTFLNRLESYEVRDGKLVLRW